MDTGFPMSLCWLEAMCEQSTQIIGQTCMHETLNANLGLTVVDRSDAASDRSYIIVELNALPSWLECRVETMPPTLTVVARYLNASSEMFWELGKLIPDKALVQVAERCAESLLRCRFTRSPGGEYGFNRCHVVSFIGPSGLVPSNPLK